MTQPIFKNFPARVRVHNQTRGNLLVARCAVARSFMEKLCGLIPRKELREEEAYLLPGCSSIHTFFMSFPILCLFLDKSGRVVRIQPHMPPGRLAFGPFGTATVLEMSATRQTPLPVETYDQLTFFADPENPPNHI